MSKDGQATIAKMVTDSILEALDAGTVPWQQGWTARGWLPTSMSSGKPYRGVNPWLLTIKAAKMGYGSPYWGTYDRIAELSGMVKQGKRWVSPDGSARGVRAGEKSTVVVFHKRLIVKDDTAEDGKRAIYMLRFYRVFNADQADGLPAKFHPEADKRTETERHDAADAIVQNYLDNGGPMFVEAPMLDAPFYVPAMDVINVPLPEQFLTMVGRYGTTFHELTHSTGHKNRLNRDGIAHFDGHGTANYSAEELIAALGSSMLLAMSGLDANIQSNASYIAGWRKALSDDPTLIIKAAGKAWKAVDHITGATYEDTEG